MTNWHDTFVIVITANSAMELVDESLDAGSLPQLSSTSLFAL